MALEKGAQAVIFDVSDDANAAADVSERTQLQLYQFIKTHNMNKHIQDAHFVSLTLLCISTHSCQKQTLFPVQSCW